MTMTAFQREGLGLLGYSKRESEFLYLVATHSGYFTNRQFKNFAQTESGSVSHAFIRKLVDRNHATYHAFRSGGRVYHLFARKVYQAIEREHLRTRKKHELDYVKTRLVALDFVIAHPQLNYLETEAEKLAFFKDEFNIDRKALPVKQYRARKSAEVTPRYFVDRFPMFVDRRSSPTLVNFTYVDAGAVSLEGLGTHLRAYAGLFRALPKLEFTYIAPTPRLFAAAEAEFRLALHGKRNGSKSVAVLHYFQIRKAWEAKERVASADVVRLKDAQADFAGREFEELYEKWRTRAANEVEVEKITVQSSPAVQCGFRTMICGSSLSVFSDPSGMNKENRLEDSQPAERPQISGTQSIEISGA